MRWSSLMNKEIINITKGEKIIPKGEMDMIINELGCIDSLLVIPQVGILSFFIPNRFIRIPWRCVKKIHREIIVIEDENSFDAV
jgi:YlmC/YmxH family sporulation protein